MWHYKNATQFVGLPLPMLPFSD